MTLPLKWTFRRGVAWAWGRGGHNHWPSHSEGWRALSYEVGDKAATTICDECDDCLDPQAALDAACALLRVLETRDPSKQFDACLELVCSLQPKHTRRRAREAT